MNQQLIEQIVKEVMASMTTGIERKTAAPPKTTTCATVEAKKDYPLGEKRPDLIKTPTNKKLADITLKGVLDGSVTAEDVRIAPETLMLQAQIADSMGRHPLAQNFRRAAELIAVPDARILEIYNALRPYRSTKEELEAIADELEKKYNAKMNADLVRQATEVYEQRDRLKKE
ncbi:diol dehydratase small subunit [Schinkia azotoformans]|uniref:diol dehydratase small subunit n=1 Tax=Schinkia azotoformans TaxID=1454 RepID=UPI002DBF9B4C|nr:diol dehydratase small subunit [Schinkia azotoformans]MEC1722512.1 diol dehydratase small subunit [Schinkia azotoformans]MED4415484.1 diol dehydratase small subunit [Schinkia azotoformans]